MDTPTTSPELPTPKLRTKDEPLLIRLIFPAVVLFFLLLCSVEVDMTKLQPHPDKQNLIWGLYQAALTGYMAGKVSQYRSKMENWAYGGVAVLIAAFMIYKVSGALL